MTAKSLFSISLLFFLAGHAQENTIIPIESSQHALVIEIDTTGHPGIIYFGKKLSRVADYGSIPRQYKQVEDNAGIYNSAYTPSGSWNIVEPAIRVTHGDGNTSLDLRYLHHHSVKVDENVSITTIDLKDPVYNVEVSLVYKVYSRENVMEQWTIITNKERLPIVLNKYASANLYFIADDYYLTHYHGTWAREMKPEETQLTAGIKTLDSKLGTRANLFEPSSFMLSFDKPATEDEGRVLFGMLGWSGNFQIEFEMDFYHNLRLIGGINPHASEYQLKSGEQFITPSFISTYSEHGKGEASRNLHNWARKYRLRDGQGPRMTLLNNWEATYFDFDETKLKGLFNDGKKLGVDLFLLDDGWFGNKYPRNSDHAGLGDWQENVKKLPHGLGSLVREATAAGIKFGIWLEPEMVSPKSELYEKHKDWVIRQPERPEHYFRNQLVLDLSNPAVQNFVYSILDSLFTKNPGIAFIKWDCNAVMFNAYSDYLKKSKQPQTQLYVDYVNGLYKILERFRAKYPAVPMMLCSGGGGRVDYEALKYFTEFWPSDDTDPLERIFIQWEYSYFYPAIATCNHVTDWSNLPLKFRTDVAMMGKMGYDIVVSKLNEKDLQFSQQAILNYKSISDLVWHNDLFRLVNPWDKPFASLMFVNEAKSKGVMFCYLTGNRLMIPTVSQTPVKLKGLDPEKNYRIEEINLYPGIQSTISSKALFSGEYLMTIGFNPDINPRRSSVILQLEEVK